jgi:hypothetical protein
MVCLPVPPGQGRSRVPTTAEIVGRELDIIAVLKRAVGGGKLRPGEAVDAIDFLSGLALALPTHQHIAHTIHNCAHEIIAKAAATKSVEKSK